MTVAAPTLSAATAAFEAAYRATRYVVPVLGLTLRVGQSHSDLDTVLRQHSATSWMFISACNPWSAAALCRYENLALHQNLLDAIRAAGLTLFEGVGEADDGQWPAESSVLVLGVDEVIARAWGERFAQNAVLFGRTDEKAQLLWCLPDVTA